MLVQLGHFQSAFVKFMLMVAAIGLASSLAYAQPARSHHMLSLPPGGVENFTIEDEEAGVTIFVQAERVDSAADTTNAVTTRQADLACTNSSFTSSIAGGFLSNNPFIRLDKTPNNYNAFQTYCFNPAAAGECWGAPRYMYTAVWNQVDRWRGKVCARSVQNAANNHIVTYSGSSCPQSSCSIYYGPRISFQVYRNGQWSVLQSAQGNSAIWTIPANETHTYSWYVNGTTKYSYRIRISQAKGLDQFDIMMDRVGGQ